MFNAIVGLLEVVRLFVASFFALKKKKAKEDIKVEIEKKDDARTIAELNDLLG